MYSQQAQMAAQKPETFMLSTEAQQALPHDAQVALQQVDNCKLPYKNPFPSSFHRFVSSCRTMAKLSEPPQNDEC
jgi:hypothetical protein